MVEGGREGRNEGEARKRFVLMVEKNETSSSVYLGKVECIYFDLTVVKPCLPSRFTHTQHTRTYQTYRAVPSLCSGLENLFPGASVACQVMTGLMV